MITGYGSGRRKRLALGMRHRDPTGVDHPAAYWQIDELECRFNTDVAEETEEFVQAWLERHRSLV